MPLGWPSKTGMARTNFGKLESRDDSVKLHTGSVVSEAKLLTLSAKVVNIQTITSPLRL
jgi:hypothetical protein